MRTTCISVSAVLSIALAGCDKKENSPQPPTAPPTAVNSITKSESTSSPPAEQKVDFSVSMQDLNKEYKANKRGFKSKYDGKRVEVSGKVLSCNCAFDLGFTLQTGNFNDDQSVFVNVVFRKADQTKFQGMKAVSRMQGMLVRGRMTVNGDYCKLEEAELVKVDPTPAQAATIAAIVDDFAKPDSQKKLNDVLFDVVVRAEVQANQNKKTEFASGQTFTISDPGKKEPAIDALLDIVSGEEGKRWAEIKPGTIVILIGQTHFLSKEGKKTLMFRNARVLNAPPEGVAMPSDK
jgi:tRNA_anti-like